MWLRCTGQRRGASSPCPDWPTALPLTIKWRVVPPPCPLPLTRPHRAPPSHPLPAPPLAGWSSSSSSSRSAASPPHRPPPPAPPRPCAHGARDCVADPSPNCQIELLPEITSLWPRPELKAHRAIASVLPMPPGHHRRLPASPPPNPRRPSSLRHPSSRRVHLLRSSTPSHRWWRDLAEVVARDQGRLPRVTSRPRRARLAGALGSPARACHPPWPPTGWRLKMSAAFFFRSSPMLLCFHFLFYALFDVSRGSFMLAPGSYG